MTRTEYHNLYKNIFGKQLGNEVVQVLKEAEEVRDMILHGKKVIDEDQRKAICDIFEYVKLAHKQMHQDAQFSSFSSMQGFKGRGK